jgi:imidazolonepropionase-like amidohydrolase
MKVLPMLQSAGIPILAGTDAGYLNSFNYPGEGLHDELELYAKAGLSPRQVLASSILTGPKFLGHAERYGAVQRGKAADLLILDANPLQSVAATRKINAVVLHGRLLDRVALDELLVKAKAAAAQ